MTSFRPPPPVSLLDITSSFQPWRSAKRGVHAEQIAGEERGFVAAGARADLEDDVLLVVRILRDEQDLSSWSSASRFAASDFSSSSASSRMSVSALRNSSSAPAMSSSTALNSRNFWTSGSSSASALAAFLYSAGSDCTSTVPRRVISSSYRDSTVVSLSNMLCGSDESSTPAEACSSAIAKRGSLDRAMPPRYPPDTGGRNATSSPSLTGPTSASNRR